MTKMDDDEIKKMLSLNPHLKNYLDLIEKKLPKPVFYSKLPRELKNEDFPNLIYTTDSPVFIHIFRTRDMAEIEYKAIEPELNEKERKKFDLITKQILKKVPEKDSVVSDNELTETFKELINEIVEVDKKAGDVDLKNINNKRQKKIKVTPVEKSNIEYNLIKEIVGVGPLECFMHDPYLEDVHIITGKKVHIIHKVFEMIKTNIEIDKDLASEFTRNISEKMGNPVSEGNPIVDGVMPDGSRVNIIHSRDVSIKGPTMTIRRFTKTPISVTELIKWGTLNSGIAAYLWLCLQYGRSMFICGETASGKTTTMNAILPFIPPDKKIYTAESTPELQVPHTVWQQLLTKTSGPKEGQVDLFDLLKAALRSRPDYIIPGEVRGAEGNIVFQAMQTGHPCITTFHAANVTKVIQRFTGDPINVPKTFMDNLDIILIQMAIEQHGKKFRRCITLEEIEGYNREVDGVMARTAFEWNPTEDKHSFKANRNSFILEEKIARNAGFAELSEIYQVYDRRKYILERMVEEDILDYFEVVQFIWTYYRDGEKGLPITIGN
jgi:flagellar protein FlaI